MEPTERVIGALGAYYVATGVAPFVSRRAFEAVTGRKREWWLVQTVGGLVLPVGAAMLSAAARGRVTPEITALAAGCAASLTAIDVVYVARRRIAPTTSPTRPLRSGLSPPSLPRDGRRRGALLKGPGGPVGELY
jgi:hypothetical protein